MSATPSSGEHEEAAPARNAPSLRILLPIAVIVAILAGVTALIVGSNSKPTLPDKANAAKTASFEGLALTPRVAAPPLDTLRNYNGSSYSLAAQHGKAAFVTFLYAHCPDVCPLIASNLHNAYAKMSPEMQGKVSIVAVSVDPHGDTPATVAAFVRQHQLTGEAHYLIGSAHELGPVWEAWKVGSEADAAQPGLVNHSALVYGVSASGKLTTIYSANFEPKQIIHDVPGLLSS